MSLPDLPLGPITLAAGLWLCLLAVTAASLTWAWFDRRSALPAMAEPVFPLAGIGVLGARLGFVILYLDAYLANPWSILNVRDGGWYWPSGVLAVLAGVGLLAWRHRERRRALWMSAGSAALVTALAAGAALVMTPAAPRELPPIALAQADGSPMPFPAGQPVVLNLWASWCPPCRREMPALIAAAKANPQVRFVLLNQGERPGEIEDALRMMAIPDSLLAWDPSSRASETLGVRGYPATFFIDAEGRIAHRQLGEVSHASLAARIEALTGAR
jgi:thiol-disulfide isomerase/thioredoxin